MRSPRLLLSCIGLVSVAALAGCGDDGPLTELEGIYTVSTWTENPQGCDAEGPSVAAVHDPMLYLKAESFFGQQFVNVVSCNDQAMCETQARDDGTLHLGGFGFEEGSDKAGWRTHNPFGFPSGDACGGVVTDATLTASGQTIRIEARTTDSAPFTGDCSDEDAEAAAAGQPCSSLEVLTATFVAKF